MTRPVFGVDHPQPWEDLDEDGEVLPSPELEARLQDEAYSRAFHQAMAGADVDVDIPGVGVLSIPAGPGQAKELTERAYRAGFLDLPGDVT